MATDRLQRTSSDERHGRAGIGCPRRGGSELNEHNATHMILTLHLVSNKDSNL